MCLLCSIRLEGNSNGWPPLRECSNNVSRETFLNYGRAKIASLPLLMVILAQAVTCAITIKYPDSSRRRFSRQDQLDLAMVEDADGRAADEITIPPGKFLSALQPDTEDPTAADARRNEGNASSVIRGMLRVEAGEMVAVVIRWRHGVRDASQSYPAIRGARHKRIRRRWLSHSRH